jgi:hypothetical protein
MQLGHRQRAQKWLQNAGDVVSDEQIWLQLRWRRAGHAEHDPALRCVECIILRWSSTKPC